MWTTVVVMALAVIFEPVRIGSAVLMLNRPRPLLQLVVFLCGGFTMGVGVGMIVLFILGATPLGSGKFAVADVQITVGLIALVVAAVMACDLSFRRRVATGQAGTAHGGEPTPVAARPRTPGLLARFSARTSQVAQCDSLWIAGGTGLCTALPSANYLGAMAVILASRAAPTEQVLALVLFNVVAFSLVEIPLVSYLASPQKTQVFMALLHSWLRSRPRRDIAGLVAVGGALMLGIGMIRLTFGV